MKIRFNVDDVLPALQAVSAIINTKNSLPILSNALLRVSADENKMNIVGSDLETQLTIPVSILSADSNINLCVDASRFIKILAKLGGKSLTFEVDEQKKEIRGVYEEGNFSMTYDTSEEYPEIESVVGETNHEVILSSSRTIFDGIKSTFFAISNDEIRPVMTGVYFDFTQDGLTFVGTDGRKLVKRIDHSIVSDKEPQGFILPKKPAKSLMSLLAQNDCAIRLSFNTRNVKFESDFFTLSCRLIEGRYPNYNSVIPKTLNVQIYIDKNGLIGALSRVSVFSPVTGLIVFNFRRNGVEIKCQNVDYSTSATETIKCAYEGDDLYIGLNGSLLDALLRSIETNDVCLKLIDSSRAVIVEPFGMKDENVEIVTLIMPMKLD